MSHAREHRGLGRAKHAAVRRSYRRNPIPWGWASETLTHQTPPIPIRTTEGAMPRKKQDQQPPRRKRTHRTIVARNAREGMQLQSQDKPDRHYTIVEVIPHAGVEHESLSIVTREKGGMHFPADNFIKIAA